MPPTTIGVAPDASSASIWGVRQLRVFGDAETVVDGDERHEPVLELAPLRRARDARQDLEAGVDLERVGGDGDVCSPRERSVRASATAISVLPTPVGPNRAMTASLIRTSNYSATGPRYRGMMATRIGAALSRSTDTRTAAIEASQRAAAALGGERTDLAIVFACGDRLRCPGDVARGCHQALRPRALVGCGAAGCSASAPSSSLARRWSVWAAAFDGAGAATPSTRR